MRSYLRVAGSRRFRATTRAARQLATAHAMVLVVVVAAVSAAWLVPFHPSAAPRILAANVAMAGAAAAAYAWLRAARRARGVEVAAFGVLAVMDAAVVVVGLQHPELTVASAGYLLLLPAIVALAVPWSTRWHVGWVAAHVATVLAYAALVPSPTFGSGRPLVILGLLAMSVAVSLFGHAAALRASVDAFVQLQRLGRLHRQARRDQNLQRRLNALLEQTARTDELTGLRNRVALQLDLAAVRSRIDRTGVRYGLLLLDVDRFKEVNDRLGHVAGDEVLRWVARIVRENVRGGDAVYRYGGEEYAILVLARDALEPLVVAERVRAAVRSAAIPHPGGGPAGCVTVSIGLVVVGPEDLDANDAAWLDRADRALYEAKRAGRDRVVAERGAGEQIELAPAS